MKDFILLIPCYNNPEGLIKSILSIEYSVEKFELLIVDDGSNIALNDEKFKKLKSGVCIEVLRLAENKGIVNALNAGLTRLKNRSDYKYIARLDAGDTCHPDRFTKQVNFLDQHPEIALLGTWCRFVDGNSNKGYDYITKTKHEDIVKEMHYKCSFIHPTVMFRKEITDTIGLYPTTFPHAEDYAFFWEIIKERKSEILPQILTFINFSRKNISALNYSEQLNSRINIIQKFGTIKIYKMAGIFLLKLKRFTPLSIIQFLKLNLSR